MSRARKASQAPKAAKQVAEVDLLTAINPHAAGIDIGMDELWVSVRADRDAEPVRRFGLNTPDLLAIAEWLKACGVETTAMESTGVYWIPLYEILEERGFQVYLVNARHAKNLPGRKKDETDAQWLRRLHTFGLLNNSFRPEGEMCAGRARPAQPGALALPTLRPTRVRVRQGPDGQLSGRARLCPQVSGGAVRRLHPTDS